MPSWCICLDLHEAWGGFVFRARRDTGRRSRLSVPFSYPSFKLTRGFTLRAESAATLSKTGPHKHFLFQKIFFLMRCCKIQGSNHLQIFLISGDIEVWV